jgi:hypothetical protein
MDIEHLKKTLCEGKLRPKLFRPRWADVNHSYKLNSLHL